MGLATIDPNSLKEHTEIHKIPKFGVNQATNTQSFPLNSSKFDVSAVSAMTYLVT